MGKGHAVSAVITSVARILQWVIRGGGVRMTSHLIYTLYAGVDPESFGGVHVILNISLLKIFHVKGVFRNLLREEASILVSFFKRIFSGRVIFKQVIFEYKKRL